MTELLLLHTITGQDMIIIDEIHVLIVHHKDLLKDHFIDKIHALDKHHVQTPKLNHFHNILHHMDLLAYQETLDLLDFIQNNQIEIHMYHPKEMANALTPTSWFYSLYLHTPGRYNDNDHPSRFEISLFLDSGASISVLNCDVMMHDIKNLIIRKSIIKLRDLIA